jgi:hypothetical protein
MRKNLSLSVLFVLTMAAANAQPTSKQPDGGGGFNPVHASDELTPQQRITIIEQLKQSEHVLRSLGKLPEQRSPTAVAFGWPVRQAPGFNDNGYYGVSNYVDENTAFPNALLDYNCGTRTYDQASGYNHSGTDIFSWPFQWQKMQRNAVQVIAAAPGTILSKTDGNFDQNCAFCSGPCSWNAVYVMHADGSVAWYGHLKAGSLTSKLIGDAIAQGEYIGVMGSSGNSTSPHLHFEVYTNSSYTNLVDPWDGPCNSRNPGVSWWANQQPYYVSTLNKVMVHGVAPTTGNCPTAEAPNEKMNFVGGETFFTGTYYRDQQNGQSATHTIYRPDGTVWTTWTQNFTNWFAASWWYYSWTLPTTPQSGNWKYEVSFGSQKEYAIFSVAAPNVEICNNGYGVLTANLTGSTYQWQVNTGSGFVNLANGANYAGVATRFLQLNNVPSSFYGYQYRCLVNGASLSNTIGIKFVSYWKGRSSKAWENPNNWICGYVPDANTDVVISDATNTPEVNSNVSCRTLTVNSSGNITVKTGFKLTVLK